MFHDLLPAAEGSYGQAAAYDFAEAPKVGLNSEPLGRTASAQAETCDHLVKNQQCASLAAGISQLGQKIWLRGDQSHVGCYRFYYHRCHSLVQLWHLVVGSDYGVGYCACGYSVAA